MASKSEGRMSREKRRALIELSSIVGKAESRYGETFQGVIGALLDHRKPERARSIMSGAGRDALLLGGGRLVIVSPKTPDEYDDPSEQELDRTVDALGRADFTWAVGRLVVAPREHVTGIQRVEDRVPPGFEASELGGAALAEITIDAGGRNYGAMYFWPDTNEQLPDFSEPRQRLTGEEAMEHVNTGRYRGA